MLLFAVIRQVAAPDGGVRHLGSVDVGGKSREGWTAVKERTQKEGLGEKSFQVVSAMRHLFGQTFYFCLFDTYWKIQLAFLEQHVQCVE